MRAAQRTLQLFIAALLLSACTTLGVPTVTTFNEQLAVGYTTVTTVRQTATTLLQAKKITADDGQNVLNVTDGARTGLDIARSISKTDLQAATNKLDAVRTILVGLQTYLASKGR